MYIANDTPFRLGWVLSKVRQSGLTCTFIVKGTYRLVPGVVAVLIDDGERPTGDVQADGQPEGRLYYESDMAPLKIKTDLLVVGSCHAPGRAIPSCRVAFQVGSFRKQVVVVGDRHWRYGILGTHSQSDPDPFVRMSLGYENSFGGPDFKMNPVGKGFGKRTKPDGNIWHPLPNIENPSRLVTDPRREYEPAGFGPIPRTWHQRSGKLGTFNESYLKDNWPWYPADFDFNHFNAAPADQRLESPLRGNESLRFENMHPQHPVYESRLSADRPQLFLREGNDINVPGLQTRPLREVTLNLDTLWVDMDQERLILVWRGLAQVKNLKLNDIAEVHVLRGHLEQTPISSEKYEQNLENRKLAFAENEAREAEAERQEREAEAAERTAFQLEMNRLQVQYEREANERLLEAREILSAQGLATSRLDRPVKALIRDGDFDEMLANLKEVAPDKFAEILPLIPLFSSIGPTPEDESAMDTQRWTRERVESQMEKGGDFSGQDLSRIDLSGLSFDGARLEGAILDRTRLNGCRMTGANLKRASLMEADLCGSDLRGALLNGADATGALLREATLAGAQLDEAVFRKSDCFRADLSCAQLRGADFSGSILREATLADAHCEGADFTEASLDGCDLIRSHLDETVLCGASLRKACLEGTTGRGADFSRAQLAAANLRNNRLTQVDFRGCNLEQADFSGAVMPDTTLEEATAVGIIMRGADLTGLRASRRPDLSQGDFRGIRAPRSFWEDAILDGARFENSELSASSFASASLRGSRFDMADMPKAVFEEAVLEKASLVSANLFRASFERAILREADLRGANLFETEFWNVSIERALLSGANLKMSKLAKRQ